MNWNSSHIDRVGYFIVTLCVCFTLWLVWSAWRNRPRSKPPFVICHWCNAHIPLLRSVIVHTHSDPRSQGNTCCQPCFHEKIRQRSVLRSP